jgi:hypothetical protein
MSSTKETSIKASQRSVMGNSAEIKNYPVCQRRPSSVFTPACKKGYFFGDCSGIHKKSKICIQLARLIFPGAGRIMANER